MKELTEEQMNKIFNTLVEHTVSKDKVKKKELNDYIVQKINDGKISCDKITFDDNDDKEYFFNLLSDLKINPCDEIWEILSQISR